MVGGAQLGGHVFVGADKALTTLGTAAAGAVGGVIDNTLGNALGIVGQQGGDRRQQPLECGFGGAQPLRQPRQPDLRPLDIAGGMLTDKEPGRSGNRATAHIATRTNLAASTTDTTVNFVIAEDPSAPYIIATARGPLLEPSYNVDARHARRIRPAWSTRCRPNAVPNIIPGMGGGRSWRPAPADQHSHCPTFSDADALID